MIAPPKRDGEITFKNGNPDGARPVAGKTNTYRVFLDGEEIGEVTGVTYPFEKGRYRDRVSRMRSSWDGDGSWVARLKNRYAKNSTGVITKRTSTIVLYDRGWGRSGAPERFDCRKRAVRAMTSKLKELDLAKLRSENLALDNMLTLDFYDEW